MSSEKIFLILTLTSFFEIDFSKEKSGRPRNLTSDHAMLREIVLNPRAPSQTLRAKISRLKVVTGQLEKYLFERVARGKSLLSKNSMAAQLQLTKLHLNEPQDLCKNVPWTKETKAEVFTHSVQQQHVWGKPKTAKTPQG